MSHYFHTSLLFLWCGVVCAVADGMPIRANAASGVHGRKAPTELPPHEHKPANEVRAKMDPAIGLWSTPRVRTFHHTLDFKSTHCRYGRKYDSDMKDLRGGRVPCRESTALDSSNGNTISEKKMDHLVNVSFPRFVADLHKHVLVKRMAHGTPIDLSDAPICREFVKPQEHATKGVHDTDIVIYTSANPFPENYMSHQLWVHACQVKKDHPIVLAVNFNPERVFQDWNETYALAEIQKALQINSCHHGEKALVSTSEKLPEKHFHGKCVKVNCEEARQQDRVKYWKDKKWTPCPSNPLNSSTDDPNDAVCPPPSEFCAKEHAQ